MPDHSAPSTSRSQPAPCRVLLLGGTGEAAVLARLILERFGADVVLTTSLAGRTERPMPIPGDVRIGGFRRPPGRTAYLPHRAVHLVPDPTHPFAHPISRPARLPRVPLSLDPVLPRPPPSRAHP